MKRRRIWSPVERLVTIKQKTVHYRPIDKLRAVFLLILSGAHGLVQANTVLGQDQALAQVAGFAAWPDQSTLSATVSAATKETVQAMRSSLVSIYQIHGLARQLCVDKLSTLDVDLTGLICGNQAEGATKGYFSEQPGRRGRQVGRIVAPATGEILMQDVYAGNKQLSDAFQPLVEATETVLRLTTPERRKRILLRTDGGGGTEEEINWALGRDYHLLTKLKNYQRTQKLAATAVTWYDDGTVPGRSLGLVQEPSTFLKSTLQVAVRSTRERRGVQETTTRVLVTDLSKREIMQQTGQRCQGEPSVEQVVLAVAHLYDERGGGVETANREDKQGLGLSQRNKESMVGQQMLVLLAELAHNVVIWARTEMAQVSPQAAHYGLQRFVRDLLQITGYVSNSRGKKGQRLKLRLSAHNPLSEKMLPAFQALAGSHLSVYLGEI
jgi:hypothetical protein